MRQHPAPRNILFPALLTNSKQIKNVSPRMLELQQIQNGVTPEII
jgi:hypothetical protein